MNGDIERQSDRRRQNTTDATARCSSVCIPRHHTRPVDVSVGRAAAPQHSSTRSANNTKRVATRAGRRRRTRPRGRNTHGATTSPVAPSADTSADDDDDDAAEEDALRASAWCRSARLLMKYDLPVRAGPAMATTVSGSSPRDRRNASPSSMTSRFWPTSSGASSAIGPSAYTAAASSSSSHAATLARRRRTAAILKTGL
jgi:hypothetical protein